MFLLLVWRTFELLDLIVESLVAVLFVLHIFIKLAKQASLVRAWLLATFLAIFTIST